MIKLRQLKPSDKRFFLNCYNPKETRFQMPNDMIVTKELFPMILNSPTGYWSVIEREDGMNVGLFNIFMNEGKLKWGIIIQKDHRRKGYAKAAISDYLEIVDENKQETHIECFEDNPARKLYKSLGYKVTGQFKLIRDRKFLEFKRELK